MKWSLQTQVWNPRCWMSKMVLRIKPSAEALVKRFPKLNVVLHSAGIMRPENLLSGDDLATAEATIFTNLLGTIRLTTAPPS